MVDQNRAMAMNMMKKNVKYISMEEYMDICDNPFDSRFSLYHFNRLLDIHGWARVRGRHKAETVAYALQGAALQRPERSTLLETPSPMSFPDAGEIEHDMVALGWSEGPVLTVAYQKSEDEAALIDDINSIWSADAQAPSPAGLAPVPSFPEGSKRPRSMMMKKKREQSRSSC